LPVIPTNLRAILAMVTAMGVFIGSDTCLKVALADAPLFQLVFMRGYAAVTLCLVAIVAMNHSGDLRHMSNPWVVARGLLELVCNFSFNFAIMHLPISDVVAIIQTCPLFVLLGARIIWGERLGGMRILLIIAGIFGALMVAQPGMSAASPWAALGFITAIAAAIRDLITRRVPSGIPPLVTALTVVTLLMLAGGIGTVIFEKQVAPTGWHMGLMLLAAVLLITGHTLLFIAYKTGRPRSVAPFMYTLTVWAGLSSVIVFNDIPNALAIAGMALVVASGLAVVLIDGRTKKLA
jgi:drug/metabolite transporter (DMT)-like permease